MDTNEASQAGDLAGLYVAKIDAAYQEEVAGHKEQVGRIVEVGRLILEAKEAVGHGRFTEYVLEKLAFGMSKAQRRMKIAECPELSNAANWPLLPAAASALIALARVDDRVGPGTLARWIAGELKDVPDRITPDITVADIDAIVESLAPVPEVPTPAAPITVTKMPPKKPRALVEAEQKILMLQSDLARQKEQRSDIALDSYFVRSQVSCLLCGKEYWLEDREAQADVTQWIKTHIEEHHTDDKKFVSVRYVIERYTRPASKTDLRPLAEIEKERAEAREMFPGFAAILWAPKMLPPAPPEILADSAPIAEPPQDTVEPGALNESVDFAFPSDLAQLVDQLPD